MNWIDRLPPGMEWLGYLINFEKMAWADDFWLAGVMLVALFNSGFILAGAWLERRHDRRLATMDAATAGVLLLTGKPPPGYTGIPTLVRTEVVMAGPPLGRISARIRSLIGGRVVTRVRDVERARREAMLRLREQAVALGAPVLAGVEYSHLGMGTGRVAVLATATALVPVTPMTAMPTMAPQAPPVPESRGVVSPRSRWEVAAALAILLGLALIADQTDNWTGIVFDRVIGRIDKQGKEPPPAPVPPPAPAATP